jgi:hypothetical protein
MSIAQNVLVPSKLRQERHDSRLTRGQALTSMPLLTELG